jgi:hypothetical protein
MLRMLQIAQRRLQVLILSACCRCGHLIMRRRATRARTGSSAAMGWSGSPAEMVDVEAKELATRQMAQLEARKAAKTAAETARAAVVKPRPATTRPTETSEQLRNRVRAGLLRRRA